MERENNVRITKKHVKERYPSFFRALSAEAKAYPGGLSELGRIIGKNGAVLSNKLNPNQLDAQPTIEDVLEIIELIGATRTVNVIAGLVGQVAVEVPGTEMSPDEVVKNFKAAFERCFMRLIKDQGAVSQYTASALSDGHIDYNERQDIADLLDVLAAAVVNMRSLVRG